MNDDGWIYFLATPSGRIKIGHSTDPRGRISTIRTAAPEPLTLLAMLPGSPEEEARLHKAFAHRHVRGEWFEDSDDIRALFALHLPDVWERAAVHILAAERELQRVRNAITRADVDGISEALKATTAALRKADLEITTSNEPGGSREEATPGSSTNGG